MKPSVLLLEDDINLGHILREHLEMNGFAVRLAVNGEEGMVAYKKGKFDLCLVDVMMPRKDGFTFARELRQIDQRTPLIFLTARSLKEDRIEGLKIGADDYVTKPFSMEELLLRIQAVLKRSAGGKASSDVPTNFTIGAYTFDHKRRTLVKGKENRKLTAREADLLSLLCVHMNEVLERNSTLKQLWGDDTYFNSRSMDVFVSKLRKYLAADSRVEIQNVPGRGIKLVVG